MVSRDNKQYEISAEEKQKLMLEKVLDEVRAFWQYTNKCGVAPDSPSITITREGLVTIISNNITDKYIT